MARSDNEMEAKHANRLWLHVKILYSLIVVVLFLLLASVCVLIWHMKNEEQDRCYVIDSAGRTVTNDSRTDKTSFGLLRVKRDSLQTKKRVRSRNKFSNDSSNSEWIWTSSFSRIPGNVLQDFCASTKDYCPPGFPGRPGFPGKKGDTGRNGENGPAGKDGIPGRKGDSGPRGEKGEPGVEGRPGLKGTMGESGENGIQGEPGVPGRRGEKGDKGDKGEAVQAKPCSCPQGPKGSKGEPGYVNTDSLIRWKGFEENSSEFASSNGPENDAEKTKESCRIRLVSKPQFQRHTGTVWGAWLRDLSTEDSSSKVWLTKHFTDNSLYEYSTIADFRKDRISKIYNLQYPFFGTGHAVYQGCFYYHRAGFNMIVRYDLKEEAITGSLSLEGATYSGGVFLYSADHNYFDLAVDENGLWVIYSNESNTESITVARVEQTTFSLNRIANISVDRKQFGNGFVACGVFYLVRDTHAKTTHIDYAFDLFTEKNVSVYLTFINPFQMNNMVTYVPVEKTIITWDKGNQLLYSLTV